MINPSYLISSSIHIHMDVWMVHTIIPTKDSAAVVPAFVASCGGASNWWPNGLAFGTTRAAWRTRTLSRTRQGIRSWSFDAQPLLQHQTSGSSESSPCFTGEGFSKHHGQGSVLGESSHPGARSRARGKSLSVSYARSTVDATFQPRELWLWLPGTSTTGAAAEAPGGEETGRGHPSKPEARARGARDRPSSHVEG